MAEQFRVEPDEQVLRNSAIIYVQGEGGFLDALKGKITVTHCGGVLTNKRFVAWSKPDVPYPFSPLVKLIARLVKGRPIAFSIPLDRLSAIEVGPGTGLTLKTSGGAGYRIASDTFFDQRDKWVEAISQAVAAACPGKKVKRTGDLVEFA